MIDWDLANRIGSALSGSSTARGPDPDDLRSVCTESFDAVVAYTGLSPAGPAPVAELVQRPEWIRANTASLAPLLEPALERLGNGSGRAASGARLLGAAALTLEAGSALGLLSRKVLGQYDLSLVPREDEPPPRLLFVAPNLGEATGALGRDGDDFLRWVAIHEVTHAVQFGSVPWLRDHLGAMASRLVGALDSPGGLPGRSLRGLAGSAAGRAARTIRHRDPLAIVMGEEEHELIGRLQSTMAVIEGHAEHVMDRADPGRIPSLPRLRSAMAQRRRSPGPLWKVLGRVLGLELKMRQYEQGRAFCDAVVDRAGMEVLNTVWEGPEAIPAQAELVDPARWIARVAG